MTEEYHTMHGPLPSSDLVPLHLVTSLHTSLPSGNMTIMVDV